MKASDITDEQIYAEVARQIEARGGHSAIAWDVFTAFPAFPEKVVFAKVRQMITKGRLRGCDCGCRGDLRFPWQEFGDDLTVDGWRERIAAYFKSGKRTYGY